MERIIKCEDCGCDVIARNSQKRYCNACLKKRQIESKKRHSKRYKVDSEGNRIPAPAKHKPKKSILDVVKLAQQANMTYGAYVAKTGL